MIKWLIVWLIDSYVTFFSIVNDLWRPVLFFKIPTFFIRTLTMREMIWASDIDRPKRTSTSAIVGGVRRESERRGEIVARAGLCLGVDGEHDGLLSFSSPPFSLLSAIFLSFFSFFWVVHFDPAEAPAGN